MKKVKNESRNSWRRWIWLNRPKRKLYCRGNDSIRCFYRRFCVSSDYRRHLSFKLQQLKLEKSHIEAFCTSFQNGRHRNWITPTVCSFHFVKFPFIFVCFFLRSFSFLFAFSLFHSFGCFNATKDSLCFWLLQFDCFSNGQALTEDFYSLFLFFCFVSPETIETFITENGLKPMN